MVGCPIFNARNSAWLGVQYLMQGKCMVGCPIFNARNSAWLGVHYLMQVSNI